MKQTPQFYEYIQQVHQYIQWQNEQLRVMNEKIQDLQNQMNKLKDEKKVTVERIEYKFDQLKVERLEGTLNIGVTPNGSGNIEDLNLNDQHIEDYSFKKGSSNSLHTKIKNEIEDYLKEDIYNDLVKIEQKNQFHLEDENYRNFIIDDIRKQIDHRIHFYLNQVNEDQFSDETEVQQQIFSKIKSDIQNGVENFFKNFFNKGN